MAYKSKYYDPAKAHEYYEKHKKLKGRKKKTSIADLSEEGKIAAKEVKERLNEELKAALKKVKKGNTAERKRLRELYNQKYQAELEQIRNDSAMVKAPKAKKEKTSKAKGSSSKASSGSSGKSSEGKKTQATTKTLTKEQRMADAITKLKAKFPQMTDKQRVEAKKILDKMVKAYRKAIEG